VKAIKKFLNSKNIEYKEANTGSLYIDINEIGIRVADHEEAYCGNAVSLINPTLKELGEIIKKAENGELNALQNSARREAAQQAAEYRSSLVNYSRWATIEEFKTHIATLSGDEKNKLNRVLKTQILAWNCKDAKFLKTLRNILKASL
jgi:hypothetical protein